MATKRNDALDIAKGLGIILVVLAHIMSPVMNGHRIIELVYKYIYTFHMPLFFFISGVVATKLVTKPLSRPQLIKQRAVRLIIPYCVWAVIYLPMKTVMRNQVRFEYEYSPFSFLLGNNPDGELWFLYVLFVLSVITVLFATKNNLPILAVMFALLSISAPFIPTTIGFESISLSFSLYQVGFFFLGLVVSTYTDYDNFSRNHLAFALSVAVFAVYCVVITIYGEKTISARAFKTVAAASGTYIFIYISSVLSETKAKKPLAYIGRFSMEIYIIHAPILVAGRIALPKLIPSTYVYIVVLTAISITLSVVLALAVKKFKWARLMLFGSK